MDETGRGAVVLATALRDAHFRIKRLARGWEEHAPVAARRGRDSLGPCWQYSDSPDQAVYLDGQAIGLAGGRTVVLSLSVDFRSEGTDLVVGVAVEDEDGNVEELLGTGPEDFVRSADGLAAELARCLDRMEGLDLPDVLR
ncbi:hypothetical protein HUT16_29925 [Kitasatospora sp. NA04385]|uniref:hypothetical protein n=1 Tax=Kitasatospora sp. NA04385 TaxID=2742135 RepID=UPI00158FEADA|nr:hypothetical protein [Kitasatospora sp. NA04385]QKW22749.1 hypothetical protein HUT16_29925 [Kitasatospora sp. NA04385]